jgi:hypothetical protein
MMRLIWQFPPWDFIVKKENLPQILNLSLSLSHRGEKMQVESRMSIKETQRITKKKCLWGVWDTREVNIKSLWD